MTQITQDDITQLAKIYAEAAPFPHIVLDNFFNDEHLRHIAASFPGPDDIAWQRFSNAREEKLASNHEVQIPQAIRNFIRELNSVGFLEMLSTITGISGLIPDPYLEGGGLHQILPGGKLGIHVDFNKHSIMNVDRRLNLLLYLNEGWQEEWGGAFEMHGPNGCEKSIAPLFNRMVIFSTTDKSYHGHPHPLECPDGVTRKSIALYYYTNGRPEHEKSESHSTVFK